MRWCLATALLFLAMVPRSVQAALPPFELAQKGIATTRTEHGPVTVDLQVTHSGKTLRDYRLKGTFKPDATARLEGEPSIELGPDAAVPMKLLWIALFASDPVAQITRRYGFVDSDETRVEVADEFVYVYGKSPRFAVARDMRHLVAIEVRTEGHRWRVRLDRREGAIVGALVTRDGSAVLTARADR